MSMSKLHFPMVSSNSFFSCTLWWSLVDFYDEVFDHWLHYDPHICYIYLILLWELVIFYSIYTFLLPITIPMFFYIYATKACMFTCMEQFSFIWIMFSLFFFLQKFSIFLMHGLYVSVSIFRFHSSNRTRKWRWLARGGLSEGKVSLTYSPVDSTIWF